MRREGGIDDERGSVKRLLRTLCAMLFVLSIVAQATATAASLTRDANHWVCAKSASNAKAGVDGSGNVGKRENIRVDGCDHCVVGQAPILSDAIAETAFSYPEESRDDRARPASQSFFSRKIASSRLPRSPPFLS